MDDWGRKFLHSIVYPKLLAAEALVVKLLRLFPGSVKGRSALIIPPYSPGSLGDEAILTAAVHELRNRGIHQMGIIRYTHSDDWSYLGKFIADFDMQDYFIDDRWYKRFAYLWMARKFRYCIAFGTDVMDGFYGVEATVLRTELIGWAARCGLSTSIAGFSYSDQASPRATDAIDRLPESVRIYSRDPISLERLVKKINHPVTLVADVAFLLEPAKNSSVGRLVENWIREQKSEERTVIGFNVSMHILKQVDGLTPDSLIAAHRDFILEMISINPSLRFVLIPHDARETLHDGILIDMVLNLLPAEYRSYCFSVPVSVKASEIKEICGLVDLVLSGRMHLAIACLGQGTPVACITYQGKFEGLFQHFHLNNLTIDPVTALQPGRLTDFFCPVVQSRAEIGEQIQKYLPDVILLARKNFIGII